MQFTYRGPDGHVKATMEEVFSKVGGPVTDASTPWTFNYQMNERVVAWGDDLNARLIKHIVARNMGLSEEQAQQRLLELASLLPDLAAKLPLMKPQLLARLASNTRAVAQGLLQLKEVFPKADVGVIAVRCPGLVLGDVPLGQVQEAAQKLRQLLPNSEVDKLVEEHPLTMLDVEGFEDALQRAKAMMPLLDVEKTMARNPGFIFGFQRGSKLIPYDEPRPEQPEEQGE